MENTFISALKLLTELHDTNVTDKFRPRIETIIKKAKNMGYGYYDTLSDYYGDVS